MKRPKLFSKPSLLSVVMAAAMIFLAIVLAVSAVSQFRVGHWFSACVSILGVILVAAACVLLVGDLRRKKEETQREQEKDHG